jgi:hypothetical protein
MRFPKKYSLFPVKRYAAGGMFQVYQGRLLLYNDVLGKENET